MIGRSKVSREKVTGVLTVHRMVKTPRTKYVLENLIVGTIRHQQHVAGTLDDKYYWPTVYWLRPTDNSRYIWKFKGRPKGLLGASSGDVVTVTATIERW